MATGWIYVLGETTGQDMKIGYTGEDRTVHQRCAEVTDSNNGDRHYVVLAAVRGTKNDERAMRDNFRMRPHGNRREYIEPDQDAVEYINWLRSQYYVSPDGRDRASELPAVEPSFWLPSPGRRHPRPIEDPEKLLQDYETRRDHLRGTAWSWLIDPAASIQDYFTPAELVNAARVAMGDVDLDAASHWLANRTHKIPDIFHVNRSAFENRWHGRVWLNPPYGDNKLWYREIARYVGSGDVEQLCMLSPIWAFTTAIARPVVRLSSAFLLLNPTPKFWGNAHGKTGTNNPHGILYIGERREQFLRAFARYGYPVSFEWDAIDELQGVA
jgi:hypothetical protein